MSNQSRWWEDQLAGHRADGADDADVGIYEPPYPNSNDPQDEDENAAYIAGWWERREKLGDKFQWRQ